MWARIIENSFAPLFIGRFSVIVGNPPWLTWTRLPERWRAATEPIWRKYGLWQVPKEAGDRARSQLASTDMAALVFATALDRYLEGNGVVGLLTPDSLLTGDPGGRAFRRFRLTDGDGQVDLPFRILHVDNWADVGPFRPDASNRPVFIVARRDESVQYPVPTVKWRRGEGVVQPAAEWAAVKLRLEKTLGSSAPVDRQAPSSAWSFQPLAAPPLIEGGRNGWEFGKGLDTRGANGIFFVKVVQSKRSEGTVLIQNGISGRDKTVQTTRGWVEADLVYPLLRGRDVQPWSARPSCYIIAPYKPGLMGELLDESTFRTKYRRAWQWLRRHYDVLSKRKAPPTRSWDIAGRDWARLDGPLSHMRGQHIVVVREQQQRPAAAVVQARFDDQLGRTVAPLIDHKLSFCAVASKQEALYLCAFINSTPIQDLLASFSNTVAIAPQTLARLPIPDFAAGGLCDSLVAVADRVASSSDVAAAAANNQAIIDDSVIQLLSISRENYTPQQRVLSRRKKKASALAPETPGLFTDGDHTTRE